MKYLAKNLKWLREQKGLKQSEIESVIGFKPTTWNNYEKGVSKPGLDDMIKISRYFRYTETDILHKDLVASKKAGDRYKEMEIETGNLLNEEEVEYKKLCELKDKIIEDKERIIAAQQGQIDALKLVTFERITKAKTTRTRQK